MKPYLHALGSAKKYGGVPSDYLDLHLFFDKTKEHVPDNRHRVVLHNSFGIFLLSQMFGETRINSDGKVYSVRDVGEDHVIEDLGMIPTLAEVIESVDVDNLTWLAPQKPKRTKTLTFDDLEKMEQDYKKLNQDQKEKMLNKRKWSVARQVLRVNKPKLTFNKETENKDSDK